METDAHLAELESSLREAFGITDGVEEAPPSEEESTEPAANEERPEEGPSPEKEAQPSEGEEIRTEAESKVAPQVGPIPEEVFLQGRRVPYSEVLEAWRGWQEYGDYLQKSASLLRRIEELSVDPKWRSAFSVLMSPSWADAVVSEDEDEWGEEERESQRAAEARPAEQPEAALPPQVMAMIFDLYHQQAQNDFERYRMEFENRYGKLTREDWAQLNNISEKYGILTENGWWTPDKGNPIELMVQLDSELRARFMENKESPQLRKRQQMEDASYLQEAADTKPERKKSNLEILEEQLRQHLLG